jgi:hypothetical protein
MFLTGVAAVWLGLVPAATAQRRPPVPDHGPVLDKISEYVQTYYSRAQSLVAQEQVERQPIRSDRSADGSSIRYQYQVRLEWVPFAPGESPTAMLLRELTAINGRPPKPNDEPRCSQPREQWIDPLTMFLPDERIAFDFKWSGPARVDGRPAVKLDFRERPKAEPVEPEVEWTRVRGESCMNIRGIGLLGGRAWVSAESGEVLRLESHYTGPIEIQIPDEQRKDWGTSVLTLDRWDRDVRYRRVEFVDPNEEMLLPERVDTLTMFRGNAMRTTQRFAGYRRFIAGGRLVD